MLNEQINPESLKLDKSHFKLIDFQGKQLNTFLCGDDSKEKLLILHGWNFFVEINASLINLLLKSYQVLSLDFPGHGKSSAFDSYPVELFIDSIVAALNHYNYSSFHIVGHSMGGMLSVICASHQKLQKFNILSITALCPAGVQTTTNCCRRCITKCILPCMSPQKMWDLAEKSLRKNSNEHPESMRQAFEELVMENIHSDLNKCAHRYTDQYKHFPWNEARDWFTSVQQKNVFVILAEQDKTIKYDESYSFISEKCPGIVLKTVQGGHDFPVMRPQFTVGIIEDVIHSLK